MFLILNAKTFDIGAGEKNLSDRTWYPITDVFIRSANPMFYLFIFVGLITPLIKLLLK